MWPASGPAQHRKRGAANFLARLRMQPGCGWHARAHMNNLNLGVIASSRKENERRLPIHPSHLGELGAELRPRIFLERAYGAHFGFADGELEPLVGGLVERTQLVRECDALLLAKPMPADLAEMPEGQVLCGWVHCVQDEVITQVAIDRRLTLIAWEAMNHWTHDGSFGLHVFHKNNELAGYCSVLHAMQLKGMTGEYGRRLRAAVIGFGATGRGAVHRPERRWAFTTSRS